MARNDAKSEELVEKLSIWHFSSKNFAPFRAISSLSISLQWWRRRCLNRFYLSDSRHRDSLAPCLRRF